jgi:membrane-bound lytic murein transglycosylase A
MIRLLTLRGPAAARFARSGRLLTCLTATVLLASCASWFGSTVTPLPPQTTEVLTAPVPGTLERPAAHWIPTTFDALPGWGQDTLLAWWPALRQGCTRAPLAWQNVCAQVLRAPDNIPPIVLLPWLESEFRVYRIEAADGTHTGLLTGYYEPTIRASRLPSTRFNVPLYSLPSDLESRRPYWTRQQIDTLPTAQASLRGKEIAWLENPLDAMVLHIQGSGRLQVQEPDGSERTVRLAYAGHNGLPYQSIGRWLLDQGLLKPGEASWPGIKAWAQRNPRRLNELLWQNPRYVFFREEVLSDPNQGPRGAQSVALTPGRSIAVDPRSVPYGTPVWIDTTEPLSPRPLQRLVMAQDTGGAIIGAVRADLFWGWGEDAETQAGRTRQPLRMWVLWPR